MSQFVVNCVRCQASLTANPSLVGKRVKCPKCGQEMVITGDNPTHSEQPGNNSSQRSHTPAFRSSPGRAPNPDPETELDSPPIQPTNETFEPGSDEQPFHESTESSDPPFSVDRPTRRRTTSRPAYRKLAISTSIFDIFDLKFEKFVTPYVIRITWMICLACFFMTLVLIVMTMLFHPPKPSFLFFAVASVATDSDSISDAIADSVFEIIGWIIFSMVLLIGVLWTRVILEFGIVMFSGVRTLTEIRDLLAEQTQVTP